MKRKSWILILAVVLLIAVLVCFVPWSEDIDIAVDGYEIDPDGTVVEQQQIVLHATRYSFLLKEDVYHSVSIEIDGKVYDASGYDSNVKIIRDDSANGLYDSAHFPYFDPAQQEYLGCVVTLSSDRSWVCVRVGSAQKGSFFVGSVNESMEPAQIWEICGEYMRK